ncbi:hypothetical protein FJY63_05595, partial [Candidatus Sumerlaeota bacterium]|nr:hypothetical protein [Candidatus Sumerlaeota bacterium]
MGSKSARWLLALSVVVILFLTGGRANAAGPTDFLAMAPSSDYAFAYLDVAKIRNSKLFTELKPALLDGPASAGLSAIQLMTGVHLLNDIDAVAVSGKVGPPPGLCAYFTGRWDAERLKNLLALNPSYTEATRTAHTIISFTDQRRGSTISLCFLKKDLAVAGSKEAVEAVVDLAAGKGASMAASD